MWRGLNSSHLRGHMCAPKAFLKNCPDSRHRALGTSMNHLWGEMESKGLAAAPPGCGSPLWVPGAAAVRPGFPAGLDCRSPGGGSAALDEGAPEVSMSALSLQCAVWACQVLPAGVLGRARLMVLGDS